MTIRPGWDLDDFWSSPGASRGNFRGSTQGKSACSLPCVHSLPAFTPGGCGLQSELKTLGRWWHLGDEERAVL